MLVAAFNCALYLKGVNEGLIQESVGYVNATLVSLVLFALSYRMRESRILKIFEILGRNCLEIYVMHCFVTGGLRVLMKRLDCQNLYLYLILGTVLGIMLPLTVAYIARRHKVTAWLFTPVKTLKGMIQKPHGH